MNLRQIYTTSTVIREHKTNTHYQKRIILTQESTLEVVVYIFHHFNQYIFIGFNKNNNEEERSTGTTGLGVSQKDLQICKKRTRKNTKKFVEKRARS